MSRTGMVRNHEPLKRCMQRYTEGTKEHDSKQMVKVALQRQANTRKLLLHVYFRSPNIPNIPPKCLEIGYPKSQYM